MRFEFSKYPLETNCYDLIITGDINFPQTSRDSLTKLCETLVADKFEELNLSQYALTQSDVLLCDNPELAICCQIDILLQDKLTNKFSDHKPILGTFAVHADIKFDKIGIINTLAIALAGMDPCASMKNEPFTPFCYSNINEVSRQWYDWQWEKVPKMVPRVANHRTSLQHYITPTLSQLIKKLQTKKRRPNPGLERLLKIMKLEKIQKIIRNRLGEFRM